MFWWRAMLNGSVTTSAASMQIQTLEEQLGAPLFDAVARFAFEVDDHEVVARHQNLSEVIVAVDAYFLPLAVCRSGGFET